LERDEEIFGKFDSLEQFTAASQFIQAEGLRYIVESNRRRKFNNSGTVIWQFNEPWPNVSCTSLVDYYCNPKMAYYWVKKAYSPVHVSMKYDKLFCRPDEEFRSEIFVHNCLDEQEMMITWEILDVNGTAIIKEQNKKSIGSNTVTRICGINTVVPVLPSGVFFVRLSVGNASGRVHSNNMYIFSQSEKEIFSSLLKLNGGKLQVECVEEGFKVINTGDAVCLFVRGITVECKECALFDENYISVFPGEEYIYQVRSAATGQYLNSKEMNVSWGFLNNTAV
jgi:beta-mannosidase